MRTPEGGLKKEVKEYLKTFGNDLWFFMPVPFGYGIRGIPDFVCCFRGRFVAIETKAAGNKPTPWQEMIAGLITKAGGLAIVAYCLDHVKVAFEPLRRARG